jgi:acyl carrier protein
MSWFKRVKAIPWDGSSSVDEIVEKTVKLFSAPSVSIGGSSHLIKDLNLSSDDLTYIALLLEESFGVRITRERYLDVHVFSDLSRIFKDSIGKAA